MAHPNGTAGYSIRSPDGAISLAANGRVIESAAIAGNGADREGFGR